MIHLHIECHPSPWSAPIWGKNGLYDKKCKEKKFAKWQLGSQYHDQPLKGHVSLDFIFLIPIPKATSKIRRRQMVERIILPTSPDTTNLQKLYEDCLQGIVIENDRYASKISSVRYYSEKPGVWIVVRRWEEEMYKLHESPKQSVC